MNHGFRVLAIVALSVAATMSSLASDGWNEAVSKDLLGRRKVELPPYGPNKPHQIPPKAPSSWEPTVLQMAYLLEGPDTLLECSRPYYWPGGVCTAYVPGQYKRPRLWVVKRSGRWLVCPDRGSDEGCVPQYGRRAGFSPFKLQD